MRPAVLLFSLLVILPLLACEGSLTEPLPDAADAELQQPLSVEPLFAKGVQDQDQDQTQEALKKQDGSCQDATAIAEAADESAPGSMIFRKKYQNGALSIAVAEDADLDGQHTETQARTRKGPASSEIDGDEVAITEGTSARKQTRSEYGSREPDTLEAADSENEGSGIQIKAKKVVKYQAGRDN